MASHILVVALTLIALTSLVLASDPSPVQDFCVGIDDPNRAVFVNGRFCKDPALATGDDFYLSGLHRPGNTSNLQGSVVTPANVVQIPGLNTLGISMVRIDFRPFGLNPPHTHPRATEILVVLEGTLYVGFVTSSSGNRLITKVLNRGDVFVFPEGLIHFQYNNASTTAAAIAGMSSQNSGVIMVPSTVFGANPPISDEILRHAFQADQSVIDILRAPYRPAATAVRTEL
ncbi:Germin-like protein subfamily 1 member [Thalictrum thalictroides]|uniref:Germin-like protein n=1 Tax=Thalictrum thalictroides TaxID=46969 RepID=A0A7J6X8M7_THATH|nr:Germin-like protein subfamily 1 member [Thalictrum thalictroides]